MNILRGLFLIVFYLIGHPLLAQKSYLTTTVGYAFPIGGKVPEFGFTVTGTTKVSAASYGNGVNFGIGYLHDTKSKISWSIDVNYLLGVNSKSITNKHEAGGGAYSIEEWITNGKGFFITPSVYANFLSDQEDKISSYFSLGVVLGIPKGTITYSKSFYGQGNDEQINSTDRLVHNFSMGLKPSVGLKIKQNNESILFIDVSITVLNPWIKELDRKGYFGDYTIKYKKKVEGFSQYELSDKNPFSSLTLKIGYIFPFK